MWTLTALAAFPLLAQAPAADARAAVVAATLDYAESYHRREPQRIERSVSRELDKLGFTRNEDGSWRMRTMRYADLHGFIEKLAAGEKDPPAGPKEVAVLDLRDRTALVKLTAVWGVDCMQLCLEDDVWRIRQVLWQSAPGTVAEDVRAADRAALEGAARDCLEAFYDVAPERIDRSVDPGLVKYGFWRGQPPEPWMPLSHDFASLREMAEGWNAQRWLAADAPRGIEVLDVLDKTAAVRLTAWWGVDRLLCVKGDDGTWRIRSVLWQSVPAGA
jgi:hypothetical protein